MVVAVAIMDMVQASVDQIIHVVSMRHHFMAAAFVMVAAAGDGLVLIRVFIGYRDFAFIPMSVVLMVQVSVMYIIYMILMSDFGMSAGNAVLVRMLFMNVVIF